MIYNSYHEIIFKKQNKTREKSSLLYIRSCFYLRTVESSPYRWVNCQVISVFQITVLTRQSCVAIISLFKRIRKFDEEQHENDLSMISSERHKSFNNFYVFFQCSTLLLFSFLSVSLISSLVLFSCEMRMNCARWVR